MTESVQFGESVSADSVRVKESAVLSRVRLRAWRRALWLRRVWSADENATNLAITHHEADRILADPSEIRQAEVSFYESNNQARELSQLIALADFAAPLQHERRGT
jgi:hypothetical protein